MTLFQFVEDVYKRQALEMLPYIDFKPDIIHCNDWQTALVPIYYSLFYANNDWYQGIKTLFTIHNIQYQGKYGMEPVSYTQLDVYKRQALQLG